MRSIILSNDSVNPFITVYITLIAGIASTLMPNAISTPIRLLATIGFNSAFICNPSQKELRMESDVNRDLLRVYESIDQSPR